jgi:chromosome segregation ATPase
MKCEFSTGDAGYREARELLSMVKFIADNTVTGSHDIQLLDQLTAIATRHIERPEFAALRSAADERPDDRPFGARLSQTWRNLVGPSRSEMELARQRIEALERAERAERSSFEALAETARVGRERDELVAEVERLQAALEATGGQ